MHSDGIDCVNKNVYNPPSSLLQTTPEQMDTFQDFVSQWKMHCCCWTQRMINEYFEGGIFFPLVREVGAHLFFLKKKWRFFHRKWWHFKWITDVGENIGERKGDILGELLEIVTFLSPFLTPFSVKIFSPNKVTISSPKMVSFLVSHKNWWIFWWRKRWFSKWIADREKYF